MMVIALVSFVVSCRGGGAKVVDICITVTGHTTPAATFDVSVIASA
jgi:hypothetical protein